MAEFDLIDDKKEMGSAKSDKAIASVMGGNKGSKRKKCGKKK